MTAAAIIFIVWQIVGWTEEAVLTYRSGSLRKEVHSELNAAIITWVLLILGGFFS